ncbi:catechol 2,3-dioxygenase-like lactoylglutathione lyase family enzyme [Deinobacterium chartae]|uniref:Catechol 2,3-dioxygenase-like lactoylglutathione lyase family enzyme n=1 Tax=Deinobacterium chartae TaxID=521158 RepID=A0A841HWZ6_9DEIO|nr:VOC family protein [Deinobacterium chartae]MBB6098051.1 catechol 2,3-dioxygenase-like lactoylglutathione lyase family enzyme [Deinobacterium chartae]
MIEPGESTRQSGFPWSGVHHIALVTPDLEATTRFYHGLLGLAVTATGPATALHGRHSLFSLGGDTPVSLHFFEHPDANVVAYPLEHGLVFLPELGALHHIALRLPDEQAGLALRRRLLAAGVTVTDVMTQGDVHDMLFRDNNGLLLEAAWPREDLTS